MQRPRRLRVRWSLVAQQRRPDDAWHPRAPLVDYILRRGVVLDGGNVAVRRSALEVGGFGASIEFRREDTSRRR